MDILNQLGKRIIFFEGGMGSILQQNGLAPGELPEVWNVEKPEFILNVHREYLKAGCDIVKTNTFGANSIKMEDSGYTAKELIEKAVSIAKQAVNENGHGLVAMDIGPTGKLLRPLGDLEFDGAYEAFKEMAMVGEQAGADIALIETMSDTHEVKAAVLAVKENTKLPVFVTMTFDENAKLLTGGDIPAAVALLEGLGVDGIGFNCGLGPTQMKAFMKELTACCSTPIIVNPNAGLPKNVNGQTVYDVNPEEFAKEMLDIVMEGAWIIGGCCGTTPAHLAETIKVCKGIMPVPIEKKNLTVISSYTHTVQFGPRPIIIGERINPTGKSRFKQALRDHDMDYILKEGIAQQENGAHILDVNVGLPDIDEKAMMLDVVKELQSVVSLPLQIDTVDAGAMEAAMRIYNGKPMLNSVSGKRESMDAVFPLMQKYGGVVVGLTLDEGGIPQTADGRVAIAGKIIDEAAKYGIDKKDIVIDVLTMTISSEKDGAKVTLEALRKVREIYGVATVLGVSNISFGLPRRPVVNSHFYTMALQNGLSAGIINPGSEEMMKSYDAYCALMGYDENCSAYIEKYAAMPAPPSGSAGPGNQQSGNLQNGAQSAKSGSVAAGQNVGAMTLKHAIERGLKEEAHRVTKELVKTREPLDIIQEELIPALNVVGDGFEKGTVFLPQLLMSADAAKIAFAVIKEVLADSGQEEETKEKIILATVKGDIHDIGKNIVKVLLENYGFDVLDLGKDVAPELIVDKALKEDVRLVGLSALMTTTVVSMEETIKQLREKKPDCKVMVGGAVLNQDYADMIGADFYGKDAMQSVHYAQELFSAN